MIIKIKIQYKVNLLLLVILHFTMVFFSCASALQFSSTERNIPSDYAGIVHAGGTRTPEEFNLLNYLGTRWILHTFYWSSIENEHGVWNFQNLDEIVDMANQAGIKILGVLAYGNQNIQTNKTSSRYIPSDDIPLFLEYVRRTAAHFRGRVDAWCIWNEPNTSHFWKGTNAEFYELTRLTADAVREVDSEVILLGGAVNRGIFGLQKKFRQLCLSIHPTTSYLNYILFCKLFGNTNSALRFS